MSEEVYRQARKKIDLSEAQPVQEFAPAVENPLDRVREVQAAVQQDADFLPYPSQQQPPRMPGEAPFNISGNVPPELQQMLQQGSVPQMPPQMPQMPQMQQNTQMHTVPRPAPQPRAMPEPRSFQDPFSQGQMSPELTALLEKLTPFCAWEEIELPSMGKFYDNIPGVLHVRAMSGNEESFLATPRHVRQGRAMDMIFGQCIRERIPTEDLLTIDRDYLLIFLRGISYTPEYDADIKCIECGQKYNATFNLNDLMIDSCPEDFTPDSLFGKLPTSGFMFNYRLATGRDDREVTRHREMRIAEYGDQVDDDTNIFRLAQLLEWIRPDEKLAPVVAKGDLMYVLRKLPINDVSYLRQIINKPPFGVDRELGVVCPSCGASYKVDLPVDVDFFFPRKKKDKTHQ